MNQKTPLPKLAISEDLSLPLDAATQTFAFIARKGAGKTYAAGKLTELLLEQGVQVVILDTVGNWYGLRLDANGKDKGFDIPVFGGLRGDLPLQATAGELIADVVVETGRSVILDLSQFSLGDRKRFATAFGERLWKNKKAEPHPTPLMLDIEEAQLIIPQKFSGDSARMVGIYEEIIRLGRNYGIGCMMITQRPQSVNKEVLNQTECLFVLQVNGAQERSALKEWIVHQGMDVKLLDELPSLPIGTAYVWSPQWLGILQKVKIAKKKTFDASATPKVGERITRRNPAPLDLGELEQKMAATIEQAKQNDPAELRREITKLRSELTKAHQAAPKTKTETVDVSVVREKDLKDFKAVSVRIEKAIDSLQSELADLKSSQISLGLHLEHYPSTAPRIQSLRLPQQPRFVPVLSQKANAVHTVQKSTIPSGNIPRGDGLLPRPQQTIIDTLAFFESLGLKAVDKIQLALFCSASPNSSAYQNNLGALRTAGNISYPQGGTAALTSEGRDLVKDAPSISSLLELHELWNAKLPKPQAAIFRIVAAEPDRMFTNEELAAAVGASPISSAFQNNRGALRTLGVLKYPQAGFVQANELLFPPGLS